MKQIATSTVLLACVLLACLFGCGRATESTERGPMQQFTIGSTDFGIDTATSTFALDTSDPAKPTITIEVAGDPAIFERLKADEEGEWSWALYPPGFYLRKFPAEVDPATGIATAHIVLDDVDNYEFAILMMEHNAIDNITVKLVPDKSLEVTGSVDLLGDVDDFAIRWHK
jgi:hypothetical protein